MCRIIFGLLNADGDILSGSNGDDPAVDFSVQPFEDGLQVNYTTPFATRPSLTVTPNYGQFLPGVSEPRFAGVVVTLNDLTRFRVRFTHETNALKPVDFSFIVLK